MGWKKELKVEGISSPVCWVLLGEGSCGVGLGPVGRRERQGTGGSVRGRRGNVTALRLECRGLGRGRKGGGVDDYAGAAYVYGSACQFAGDQRRFPLGQVLGGGDVVPRDLRLLWCSCWQLLVLYLCFRHVVISRIKVFLLQRQIKTTFKVLMMKTDGKM